MTIRVELNPETEARLIAEARAKGVPLEKVAEQLLKEALHGLPLSQRQMSVDEFHRMLDAIAEGSESLPDLPTESFSRESFYEDRLDGGDAVLCYTSQNVAEFWNACTRPVDRNGYGLSPQDTDHRARLFEEKLRLLPDSLAVHEQWRRLLVTHSVSGVQVHDARLVAAMLVHGVKHILTFNDKDFARYTDIEAVHPRSVPHV